MAATPIDRREFHRFTAAALSGLATGAVGCNQKKRGDAPPVAATAVKSEVHLCRGLNDCKGMGKEGKNGCRGQGNCATAKDHSCGGQNECKGLGGCGDTVGSNECKGQGGCHVPLMADAWDKLRKQKESAWAEKKLEFGPAPAAATEEGKGT